jgi:ParB-like chromosome segregation protein Spo0J
MTSLPPSTAAVAACSALRRNLLSACSISAARVASIAAHGLLFPIALTADGTTIVDGRLRYLACVEAGIEPEFTRLPASFTEENIVEWIVSANMIRSSVSYDQRAMIAADIEKHLAMQASSD